MIVGFLLRFNGKCFFNELTVHIVQIMNSLSHPL